METKIVVYYGGINYQNEPYFEELIFDTDEEADRFILDIKTLMFGVQSYTKIITWVKKEEMANDCR